MFCKIIYLSLQSSQKVSFMKSLNYIKVEDGVIEAKLDVLSYVEEGVFFVFAPALDMTGYGNSLEEAKTSFEITLQEYFKYTLENKTLDADLRKHGWVEKKEENFSSPLFSEILRKDKQLRDIVNHDYTKVSEQFSYSF